MLKAKEPILRGAPVCFDDEGQAYILTGRGTSDSLEYKPPIGMAMRNIGQGEEIVVGNHAECNVLVISFADLVELMGRLVY